MFRFLAGAVQDGAEGFRKVRRGLQQQRRLADSRFAADEHERSRNNPSSKHAIEFIDSRGQTLGDDRIDVGIQLRTRGPSQAVSLRVLVLRGGRPSRGAYLDEGVPGPAPRAAPEPLL